MAKTHKHALPQCFSLVGPTNFVHLKSFVSDQLRAWHHVRHYEGMIDSGDVHLFEVDCGDVVFTGRGCFFLQGRVLPQFPRLTP